MPYLSGEGLKKSQFMLKGAGGLVKQDKNERQGFSRFLSNFYGIISDDIYRRM